MLRHAPAGEIVQFAFVVRDLDVAVATWVKSAGAGPFFVAPFCFEGQHYRGAPLLTDITVAVGYQGNMMIELVQPAGNGPSVYSEILNGRGEGLHHMMIKAADFDAEVARQARLGHPEIAGGPIPGFGRSVFVDATADLGCFLEFGEFTDPVLEAIDGFREAHRSWDGRDPVRPYPTIRAS